MTKALELEQAISAATRITASSLRRTNQQGAYAAQMFLETLKKICGTQDVQIRPLWPEMTNTIASELVSAIVEGTNQQGNHCGQMYADAVAVLSKG